MAEKILAFCIAVILVAGKLMLEMQMRKDREHGIELERAEYRYGRIMARHIRDLTERVRTDRDGEELN